MPELIRIWWWEMVCFGVYAVLTGVQLFQTPIIGLADNGDFPKVLGPMDICAPDQHFSYVVPVYRIDPSCSFDGHITSSETAFVRILKQVGRWTRNDEISIQSQGRVQWIVALAALAILLWTLRESRPIFRFGLPPLIILIFSDVAYVAYLNSFYMDAAAIVFLLLTLALACAAILRPKPWIAIAYGIAAVFFITAKAQHALLGPLLALLALYCWRLRGRRLWIASAVAVIAASGAMVASTTAEYRAQALYNLIFFRFAKQSPHPTETLLELGLPPMYLPLIGTHSFNPNVPVGEPAWQTEFLQRTSYFKLASYYLNHPQLTFDRLWETLSVDAPGVRSGNLGNYRRQDGYPPGALTDQFATWSDMTSWLFRTFPLHAVALYLLIAAGCIWALYRPAIAVEWPLYPVCLMLLICGGIEFLGSALLDCLETARHLFLFHAITDILIIFVVASLPGLWAGLLSRARKKL